MNSKSVRLFKSFFASGFWLLLLGVATAVEKTVWGSSGHPSNGVIVLFYIMLGAPLFGLGGFVFTLFDKTQNSYPTKPIALAVNVILIVTGAFLWNRRANHCSLNSSTCRFVSELNR